MGTITVTPLAPALGAEVAGVDIAAASERDVLVVRDAVLRHAVVVLRDQSRRPEDQLAFTERLGPLRPATALNDKSPPGFPQMTVISNIVEDGRPIGLSDAGLPWTVQIGGRPRGEEDLLPIALAYQAARPFWRLAPKEDDQ